ncbi:hypothetical protein MMC24_005940 [Lignoscripta atroalba]|nr:hypothetical protein [Lignoscripta atroalba]
MASRKVIQDSDDEDGEADEGRHLLGRANVAEQSGSTVVDLERSPPGNALRTSCEPSTGSTGNATFSIDTVADLTRHAELLTREIHEAHNSLREPTPDGTISQTSYKNPGQTLSVSPTMSRLKRRQTTIGHESHEKKRVLKTYGSKASQDDISFHSSEGLLDLAPRKKRGLVNATRTDPMDPREPSSSASKPTPAKSLETLPSLVADQSNGDIVSLAEVKTTAKTASRTGKRRSTSIGNDGAEVYQLRKVYDDEDADPSSIEFAIGSITEVTTKASKKKVRQSRRATAHATATETHHKDPTEHRKELVRDASMEESMVNSTNSNNHPRQNLSSLSENHREGLSPSTAMQSSGILTISKPFTIEQPDAADYSEVSTIPYTTPVGASKDNEHVSHPTISLDQMATPTRPAWSADEAYGMVNNERVDSLSLQISESENVISRPGTVVDGKYASNAGETSSHQDIDRMVEDEAGQETGTQSSREGRDELSLPSFPPVTSKTQYNSSKSKVKRQINNSYTNEPDPEEVFVGLPKEQYQPRPSRSRANCTVDDLVLDVDYSKRPEAVLKRKNKRRKTMGDNITVHEDGEVDSMNVDDHTSLGKVDVDNANLQPVEQSAPISDDRINTDIDSTLIDEETSKDSAIELALPRKKRGRPKKHIIEETDDGHLHTSTRKAEELGKIAVEHDKLATGASAKKSSKRRKTGEDNHYLSDELAADDNEDKGLEKPILEDEEDPAVKLQEIKEADRNIVKATPMTTTDPPAKLSKDTTTTSAEASLQTPQKQQIQKGPDKHSPLNNSKVAYRVGLSKRARIEPLLRIVKK